MTETVFYVFAAVAVLSAAMCILQRSPVAALIWLVQTMLALGAIFVLLSAQFIGLIQILVYAGAIMVLFLFIIMLLNLGQAKTSDIRGSVGVAATIAVAGLLFFELGGLWFYTPARLAREVTLAAGGAQAQLAFAGGHAAQQAEAARGVVGAVAGPLFQEYLVPFEITSILLLTAIVGAVVLAKRNT
jgi:NADH-quinone oxidoreductase subunit J